MAECGPKENKKNTPAATGFQGPLPGCIVQFSFRNGAASLRSFLTLPPSSLVSLMKALDVVVVKFPSSLVVILFSPVLLAITSLVNVTNFVLCRRFTELCGCYG